MLGNRWIWSLGTFLVAMVLLYLLFASFGATLRDLLLTIVNLPAWAIISIFVLTALNQIIGALKWRTAASWLAPSDEVPGITKAMMTTTLGALLGQLLQAQASVALVRWIEARRTRNTAGWAVGSTLYEQLFDLFVLVAAAVSAGIVYATLGNGVGVAELWLGVMAVSIIALPVVLSAMTSLLVWCDRLPVLEPLSNKLVPALSRARDCPVRTRSILTFWSGCRLLVLVMRTLVVALALAPHIDPSTVALGYPVAALVTAVPITPAGLGIAEWTWSGILVAAGAAPAVAAIIAVSFRVAGICSLIVLVLILHLVMMWKRDA